MCEDRESVRSNELSLSDASSLDGESNDTFNSFRSKFSSFSRKTTSIKELKNSLREATHERER